MDIKEMDIKASKSEIGAILTDRKIYKVPLFQRNFSWGRQQFEELWDDIMNITDKDSNNHFMGSMVFTPLDRKSIQILDGRQRLATLLLLLAALRDLLRVYNKDIDENKKGKWITILNNILYTEDIPTLTPNPKLELNGDDKQFFENIIIEGNISDTRRNSHKLIKDCYEFFKEQIEKQIEKSQNYEIFIQNILGAIFDKLLIIRIDVDNEIDAHMIFETLNDRGLALTASDLLKNYIFSLAASTKCLEIADDSWKRISDNVGDDKLTKFLRHYYVSIYERITKEELYKKLREKITHKNVKHFISELDTASEVYANLLNPTNDFWNDKEIVTKLNEINILKEELVYPLLLSAYDTYYKKKNKKNFKRILDLIITLTFRYNTICNLAPNELERKYSELAIKLRNNKINIRDVVNELASKIPNDELFVESFKHFTTKNNKLAKYILIKINKHLLQNEQNNISKELTIDSNEINLEHIIPKKPNDEWKKFFRSNKLSNEDIDELIYKIGNMTILLEEYNRKAKNGYFDKKKEIYKKSCIPTTKKLSEYTQFGKEQVEEMQNWMASIAKEIWSIK